MAGDWIKMRGSLLSAPKVIAIAAMLHEGREFRDWLTPGGGGPADGQIISGEALRCVTVALLMRVWSIAREHGHYVGDDLVFPCICIDDLDQIANVVGMGAAMHAVGWAVESEDGSGVTLPNFREYNVPLTPAEKQQNYRDRKKCVTNPLPHHSNGALPPKSRNVTPREEKIREDKSKKNPPFIPPSVDEVGDYCRSRSNSVDPEAFVAHYQSNGWRVGKNPMKDWRAAVRTWEKNEDRFSAHSRNGKPDVDLFKGVREFLEAGQ